MSVIIILLTIPFIKNIFVQLNEMVLPFQGQRYLTGLNTNCRIKYAMF